MDRTTVMLNAVAALVLCLAGLCLYRLYFDPLAGFPGPKLAAITRYYEAYYDMIKDGQYTFKIAELHKQYGEFLLGLAIGSDAVLRGPIIRISPYELHINDPSYYEKLYRHDGRWERYRWTYDAFGVPYSMICTADHHLHKNRRAPLNSYFSRSAVVAQQDRIEARIEKLCSRIDELVASKSVFNIGAAFSALTSDIATEYILNKPYNNLDRKDFNQNMANFAQGSGMVWRIAKHIRLLASIAKSMPPSWIEMIGSADMRAFLEYLETSKKQTREIIAEIESGKSEDETPRTIIHNIISSPDLPPSEKEAERINDDVDTIVGAASETTAATLRLIIFYAYRNPAILMQLRTELRCLPINPKLSDLEKVNYLTAVIMEGLRLAPGVATRLARIAPDRNLMYNNKWVIPAGTPVGMTTLLMHLDEVLYPEPTKFNPERWVNIEDRRKADKTYAPFSRGSRICLGMHLAWAELYLTLAAIVRRYDFEFEDTGPEEVDAYSDQFIIGTRSRKGVIVVPSLAS